MIEAIFLVCGLIPATLAASYYCLFTILGRRQRGCERNDNPVTRFTILVPAHNEELSLPATLVSLAGVSYDQSYAQVVVVADNCGDATAAVARAHGVEVIERTSAERRGKGYALEDALNIILPEKPDAVLIFDADGELDPMALRVFDARFQAGASVVQGSIRTRNVSDGATVLIAAVGNVLDDEISAGRDRLGCRVPLRGSNMAFRREVLERHPWRCHGLTEDAEYADVLHRAGVRVRFEPGAKARSESPPDWAAMRTQRRRWKAAFHVMESKPLVLAQLLFTTALAHEYYSWLGVIWLMTLVVYVPAMEWRSKSLMQVPGILLRMLFLSKATSWQRTRRVQEV